jgi:MFS family permease
MTPRYNAYSSAVVSSAPTAKRAATLAVIVAGLGYFVDIYDLILFGMVRGKSLTALGEDPLKQGLYLINMQMYGMLIGGILWGVIGDKRGRLSVLFGSIILYSLANIANGMVETLDQYAACRFIAGLGLAGELGAGITLVSELMGRTSRGIGTTIVAALGVSGGVLAGLIGGAYGPGVDWRVAYYIGGGLGLALLVLRIGVVESGMFHATAKAELSRGNFFQLFTSGRRFLRYLGIILVGVPIWFVIGIMFTFAKEIGADLGLDPAPLSARALFYCYAGCTVGGVLSGVVSQRLESRRKSLAIFVGATGVAIAAYFTLGGKSPTLFYALCAFGGMATGYWAVFVSTAAELFGTNLRATVTTTVPNFVRGSVPLLTAAFTWLKDDRGLNISTAAVIVGVGSLVLATAGLFAVPETFGVDLDFHEGHEPLPKATVAT